MSMARNGSSVACNTKILIGFGYFDGQNGRIVQLVIEEFTSVFGHFPVVNPLIFVGFSTHNNIRDDIGKDRQHFIVDYFVCCLYLVRCDIGAAFCLI